MAKKGKTGMGKAIGKLIAMAKKEAGNLKEQAKVAAKQKINELEDEIREKLPTKEEIYPFNSFILFVRFSKNFCISTIDWLDKLSISHKTITSLFEKLYFSN